MRPLVTIVVGREPHQQRFSIPEGIICARSEFFKRALNGNWAESEGRIVRFPEDNPEIFGIYMNLVYTGLVLTDTLESPKTVTTICDEFDVLGNLYVLCEKLQDRAAKNSAVESLLEVSMGKYENKYTCPRTDTIVLVYRGTCAGSLGRRLMVDLWRKISVDFLIKCSDELPKEFLADLAISMKTQLEGHKIKGTWPLNKNTCMEKEA
ncbi:hypothetical protein J4E90_000388 [Alternaria incomplexa]|uniref:uncharacterized protein n=1 Tax=Alternaria incomplexa TaxID=1187928 RepID=UPI002221141B|nr:uncharacterized protein J4E90_000388 [Alternaria incomplexa]KAI4921960.1 hypothetical protein J4E90_000388 [Alternaria incomplexa]